MIKRIGLDRSRPMRNLIVSLGIAIFLLISGCGNNNSVETTSYLPQEINTNKLTLLTKPKVDGNVSLQRYGHHTLQNHLESIDATQKLLEVNLLLAESLLKDIKSHCEGTGLGELCDIDSETFSLVFDDDLINQMSKIAGESLEEEELAKKGQKIPFGKMTYIEYDETEVHQYNLLMDTTIQEKFLGSEGVDSGAEIKWSEDKSKVFSFYSFNDGNLTNTLSLDLNKTESDAQVGIENNVSNSEGNTYNYCYIKLADVNQSLNIIGIMNTNDTDYELSSQFYVTGELSQDKPYLNYFGQINQIGFEEHTIFDNNNSIVSSKFCNANLECNLSDESTWFRSEDKKSDELLYDVPVPVSLSFHSGNIQVSFETKAKQGSYYMLAPETDLDDIENDKSLLLFPITFFMVNNDFTSKVEVNIDTYLYNNKLDKLAVVYENSEKEYTLLTENQRPTISHLGLLPLLDYPISVKDKKSAKDGKYVIFKSDFQKEKNLIIHSGNVSYYSIGNFKLNDVGRIQSTYSTSLENLIIAREKVIVENPFFYAIYEIVEGEDRPSLELY